MTSSRSSSALDALEHGDARVCACVCVVWNAGVHGRSVCCSTCCVILTFALISTQMRARTRTSRRRRRPCSRGTCSCVRSYLMCSCYVRHLISYRIRVPSDAVHACQACEHAFSLFRWKVVGGGAGDGRWCVVRRCVLRARVSV
jgi:hypothetical protein